MSDCDVDTLTRVFIRIRDEREKLKRAFTEKDATLIDQQDKIKEALLELCNVNNVTSVKTESGSFYRTTKTKFWTSDWEKFHEFILEHGCPELLEKRVHQGNIKEWLTENEELVPQGLNASTEYSVSVRRK